jgi:hypothetical protein
LETGLAGGELEELRHRAIRNVNAGKKSMNETKSNKEEVNITNSEDEIEDRTREHY